MKIITRNERETEKLGEKIAKKLLTIKRGPQILCLVGDLGGGKTTFLRGFAKGLRIRERILSPTFILMRRFRTKNLRFKNFYHLDCYRIKNKEEIFKLQLKKIMKEKKNIVAIEWAEKIKKVIPPNAIWIKFKILGRGKRKIGIYEKENIFDPRR